MNAGCRQCQTDRSFRELRQRALWHFGKCQRAPPVLLPARVSVLPAFRRAARRTSAGCAEMEATAAALFSGSKRVPKHQRAKTEESHRNWLLL